MTSKCPLRKALAALVFTLALAPCPLALTTMTPGDGDSSSAVAPSAAEPAAVRKRGKQRRRRARRRRVRREPLPPASLAPMIVPPGARPVVRRPSLPVPPAIQADPMLIPPDTREIPYGDPAAKKPEARTGTGAGEGRGIGPGRGGNTGGGGGAGASQPSFAEDGSRVYSPREVTRKAVILSRPEPGYTVEARNNQVAGTVRVRAVLTASGAVTDISVIKGLPDGLTERAVEAARQVKFHPAQKDGRDVSQWVVLEYNFNLY